MFDTYKQVSSLILEPTPKQDPNLLQWLVAAFNKKGNNKLYFLTRECMLAWSYNRAYLYKPLLLGEISSRYKNDRILAWNENDYSYNNKE